MKKYLLSLTTLALLLCEASFTGGGMAFAATSLGNFGTNLTASIDGKTLTISVVSGKIEGTMPYWTSSNYLADRPWKDYITGTNAITTVIINKGVKNIGSYAFYGCSALATVKFGTSTTDTCSIDTIGTAAFTSCNKVATVYCYGSTSTLAMRNWLNIGMYGTTSNPFAASTVKGSSKKFYMNSSNTTTLTTTNLSKATKIKPYAFYKHSQLTSVTLPSTVKSIGNFAFANDSSLATVKFGSGSSDQCGLDTIMSNAFSTCVALSTIYCYGGIEKWLHIGFNAGAANPLSAYTGSGTKKFYLDGTSITTLTIPEGITKIKGYAFYKHTQFTKISLPSTVSYVGAYALAYCTGLTDLVALPTTPPNTESSTFNNITPANINLYVASAASAAYGSATRWSAFTKKYTKFEDNCGASGDNITFELNFAEHSLTLTGSGAMATYGYSSPRAPWYTFKDDINTIIIGSGITGIGAYAFKDCANVTSASIPASITSIGSSAFDGCKAMTSYSYAGTIAQWLGITFGGSSSNPMCNVKKCYANGSTEVNNLVIPDGITTIGNYAFYQCSGLTSVTLPASLTSVGTAAFSTCTNIANTNFLGTIDQWCGITFAANIANPAFFSKQLSINGVEQTNIYLSDDLAEIKNYVFEDNRALERVSIKNTTTINTNAFKDCAADIVVRGELAADFGTGLHWSLLDGVLTISKVSGEGVMPDYSTSTTAPWYPYRKSVSKIVIEEGVTQIGKYSFQGFTGSTGVYLPVSLGTINDYAFYQSTGIIYIVSKKTTAPTVIDSQTGYSGGPIYDSNAFTGIPTNILIYVPSGSESSYSTAVTSSHSKDTGWKRFSTFVPCITFSGTCGATGNEANVTWEYKPADKSLTISGSGAMADFANNNSARPWNGLKTVIASLSVVNDVTTIGKYAFYGCTAITSLNNLPNSLTTIGYQAFDGCTGLTSFTLPEYVIAVGDDMVRDCSSLASVTWNARNCTQYINSSGTKNNISTTNNPFYGSTRSAVTSFTFGNNVQTIANGLCYNMSNLTSITIPSSVETIGTDAFKSTGLTSISIPNNVTSIGTGAFQSCTALASVTLPSGITSIGSNTFNGCTALTSLDIPAAVESIGNYAFKNCTGLTEMHSYNTTAPSTTSNTFDGLSSTAIKIYVPTYAAKLDYEADDNWDADLRTIIALGGYCGAEGHEEDVIWTYDPDEGTLTISGTGAMADYNTSDNRAPWYDLRSDLTKLVIEEGVTTIGANAFYASYSFTEISFPASLEESKSASFATINGPTRVNYAGTLAQWCDIKYNALSSTPMNYGTPAFYANGTQITGTVTVPEGVDIIKGYTLINLGITNLYLPSTLDSIGSNAFDKNTGSLTNVYYAGSAADWCRVKARNTSSSYPLYVGKDNNPQLYCNGVKPTSLVVPAGVTTLNDYHFYNCQELTSVTISESITAIGANTFKNCSSLTTIIWNATNCPNFNGTSYAPFYNVRSQITSITFGSSVQNIPGYLCYGMNNAKLTSISIPNSVQSIGNYAFRDCSHLTTFTIGEASSLATMGYNVFENCTALTAIHIPNSLTALPKETFMGCSALASVTYGDNPSLATIGQYAFKNCTSLASITIPASVTSIDCNAGQSQIKSPFYGCTSLNSVVWNAATCSNFTYAYYNGNSHNYYTPFYNEFTHITSFTFGNTVEHIPSYLCYGMTGLTEITIPSSVTSIGANAFLNCSNITSVTMNAESVPTISSNTFPSEIESSAILTVPYNPTSRRAYSADSYWSEFATIYPYILTFNMKGHGTAIDEMCVGAGRVDEALQPADPTEDYYTFDGWFSNEACTTPFTFGESGTVVNGDLTLYAKWTIYNYQVTFDLQGHGDAIPAQTIDHNGLVSKPSDPSAEYYTFGGWYKEAGCSNEWNFSEDHVTSATTLYAKWTLEDLTLNDNANNASVLELYDGESTNVHLTRSLISASYNTICLPFAMTAGQVESAFGADCDIEELTRASYADGNLKLFFTKRTAIEAGKPYLIQPQSDVANPTIAGVTIDNTSHPSVFDGVTFTGIFSPTALADSESLLFLGASNTLYMSSGGQMKGLRAYFELTTPAASAAARRSARIILHEEGATGIEETITNDQSPITNKIIRDGQLFILRDGKTYNAQGALIK